MPWMCACRLVGLFFLSFGREGEVVKKRGGNVCECVLGGPEVVMRV